MKHTLTMKPKLPFTFTMTTPIYHSLLNSPKSYHLYLKFHTLTPLFSPSYKYTPNLGRFNTHTLIKAQNNVSENEPINELQFVEIKNPNLPNFASFGGFKFSFNDQAFFLFTFIAFCVSAYMVHRTFFTPPLVEAFEGTETSAAFVGFVAAAVPTLFAMGRAANSFAKLADAAREELPSTMAAVRLSGMEVSDLTLELTELSQEVSEGVDKSAEAVEAAKSGIQQIGDRARVQTSSMIEERANLPEISLQEAVSSAAKMACRAAGRAAHAFLDFFSKGANR